MTTTSGSSGIRLHLASWLATNRRERTAGSRRAAGLLSQGLRHYAFSDTFGTFLSRPGISLPRRQASVLSRPGREDWARWALPFARGPCYSDRHGQRDLAFADGRPAGTRT